MTASSVSKNYSHSFAVCKFLFSFSCSYIKNPENVCFDKKIGESEALFMKCTRNLKKNVLIVIYIKIRF